MAAPNIPDDIRSYMINTLGVSLPVDVNDVNPIQVSDKTSVNRYAVIEYLGLSATRTHGGSTPGSDIALDNTMVQIVSRHRSAQTARDNLKTIVDALDGLQDVTIGSVQYTYFQRTSPIRKHEKAEDGSVTFITEFRVQARR